MRPYMCTPHPEHAWRWIGAAGSTTLSLSPFAVTVSLSRGTTATSENSAPAGFQHLLQPHAWLNATLAPSVTVTGALAHLHVSVPPLKSLFPALTPSFTAGWMLIGMTRPLVVGPGSSPAASSRRPASTSKGADDRAAKRYRCRPGGL